MKLERPTSSRSGFSLIELVLAISIIGLCLIPLVGMLPVGLTIFHADVDTAISTEIAQRLLNEAQQTSFANLENLATAATTYRYFDGQGNELPNSQSAVYETNLYVQAATILPGATPSTNTYLATVTIQIARNVGGRTIQSSPLNPHVWGPTPGIAISSYTAMIAQN